MDDAALALKEEHADVERVAVDAPDWRAGCGHGDEDGNAPSLGVQLAEERIVTDPLVLDEVMRKDLRIVERVATMAAGHGLPESDAGEEVKEREDREERDSAFTYLRHREVSVKVDTNSKYTPE